MFYFSLVQKILLNNKFYMKSQVNIALIFNFDICSIDFGVGVIFHHRKMFYFLVVLKDLSHMIYHYVLSE